MGRGAILRRLLLVPPTLFGVAVVVFVLLRVVPGDPVSMMIPPGASQADVDRLRALYGLDLPIFDQFIVWLKAVAVGDFGTSISRRQNVMSLILSRLPATLELVLLALLIAFAIGAGDGDSRRLLSPQGAGMAGRRIGRGLARDPRFSLGHCSSFSSLACCGRSCRSRAGSIRGLESQFHTGFYLIESIVTGHWRIAGDLFRHAILPAVALALPLAAIITRLFKASLGEAELQDYAQVARARGFARGRVLIREALPNAVDLDGDAGRACRSRSSSAARCWSSASFPTRASATWRSTR